MKKFALSLCLMLLLLVSITPDTFGRNKLESWYTYWGLGYAGMSYPDDLQDLTFPLADCFNFRF